MHTPDTPLDLDSIDTSLAEHTSITTPGVQDNKAVAVATIEYTPLVNIGNMASQDIARAQDTARSITIANPEVGRAMIGKALTPVEASARQSLSNVRVQDMEGLGKAAAAIIDGIQILRIEDLKAEASNNVPAPVRRGFGKMLGLGRTAVTALQSFEENRTQFLTVIDRQTAEFRRLLADGAVRHTMVRQQHQALMQSAHEIKILIVAYQYALEREIQDFEAKRILALEEGDPVLIQEAVFTRDRILALEREALNLKISLMQIANAIPANNLTLKAIDTLIQETEHVLRADTPMLINAAATVAQAAANRGNTRSIEKARELSAVAGQMAIDGARESALSVQALSHNRDNAIDALEAQSLSTIQALKQLQENEEKYRETAITQEERLIAIRDRMVEGAMELRDRALSRPL